MASRTELVGILNATPDSFSDGGLYESVETATAHAGQLFEQGAAIVDVGAESTRPSARTITPEEEWQRLEAILEQLIPGYTDCISLDTRNPSTIRRAAGIGSVIINDVTSFNNPEMREVAAEFGFRCIVSHLPSSVGRDIEKAHQERSVDSVKQVYDELLNRH